METTETGEVVETSGNAHQCRKKSKRQSETDRDQGDWRDCGDQWRCKTAKEEEYKTVGD